MRQRHEALNTDMVQKWPWISVDSKVLHLCHSLKLNSQNLKSDFLRQTFETERS